MNPILPHLDAIVEQVKKSTIDDWHPHRYTNDVQDMIRLTSYFTPPGYSNLDKFEIQLNLIDHSEKPHIHNGFMTSLILDVGYAWYLDQNSARTPIYQFAAPGSIVTMGPIDTHWIPRQSVPSLSLCIFEKSSDWWGFGVSIDATKALRVLVDAKRQLKSLFNRSLSVKEEHPKENSTNHSDVPDDLMNIKDSDLCEKSAP